MYGMPASGPSAVLLLFLLHLRWTARELTSLPLACLLPSAPTASLSQEFLEDNYCQINMSSFYCGLGMLPRHIFDSREKALPVSPLDHASFGTKDHPESLANDCLYLFLVC